VDHSGNVYIGKIPSCRWDSVVFSHNVLGFWQSPPGASIQFSQSTTAVMGP
jgi:hypothetical protein